MGVTYKLNYRLFDECGLIVVDVPVEETKSNERVLDVLSRTRSPEDIVINIKNRKPVFGDSWLRKYLPRPYDLLTLMSGSLGDLKTVKLSMLANGIGDRNTKNSLGVTEFIKRSEYEPSHFVVRVKGTEELISGDDWLENHAAN